MLLFYYYLTEKRGVKTTPVYKQFSDDIDAGELLRKVDDLVRKFRKGDLYKSIRIVVNRDFNPSDPCFTERLFDLTFTFNLNKYGNIKKSI